VAFGILVIYGKLAGNSQFQLLITICIFSFVIYVAEKAVSLLIIKIHVYSLNK